MIWISLGSNLGDRAATIDRALTTLDEQGVRLLRQSQLYETPPWGDTDQPPFLNAVAEVRFGGEALDLLDRLLHTEDALGRVRSRHWGPRTIDLDLLECRRERWDHPRLTLPHPYYPQRAFVLRPLAELEPDWVPTGQTQTVTELLAGLDQTGIVPWEGA